MIENGVINGKLRARFILDNLRKEIARVNLPVKLSIILVGDDPSSAIYVRNKMRAAKEVGIEAELYHFDQNISQQEILSQIHLLNQDSHVSGIIVQLPLPAHIDKTQIASAIFYKKDVDGLNPFNVGMLYSGYSNDMLTPCTALGCFDLINLVFGNNLDALHALGSSKNNEYLAGKHAVIIGRSNIVGRPLAALLLKNDCTVTICHSKTSNMQEITNSADIVITAVGKPQIFTQEYFNTEEIVIDVGISRTKNKSGEAILVGDVDFHNVKDKVKFITPVPGGVGPMTIAYLLVNSLRARLWQQETGNL